MTGQSTNTKIVFYLGAALSLVISFIIFFKTMAPTVSFWDCGEFIACAKILGVPHPPGTPLFVLIGKFFILLGIMSTPALNTNLISVISSSLTAMMAYFIIAKVAGKVVFAGSHDESGSPLSRYGIYAGALSGSLIMAFSSTFWFNAVETEVYGLAMLVMAILTYMALIWGEKKAQGGNDIMLIAISYLLFLSIGIHLTVFLITPALILYFVLVDRSKLRDWRFWVAWSILFSFAMPVYVPIQLLIPKLLDWQIETWIVLMLGFAALAGYYAFIQKNKNSKSWQLYFAIMVAAIIGFTPHLYIPIRAAEKPAINENNPDSWSSVKSYLERKQYGQESMVTRMFTRRAEVKHQFGNYPHMGYWGYFKEQYSSDIWGLLRYLPFLIGLYGLYISLRKTSVNGFLLAAIFLISSLGLILYLNFADGTRGEHLEVRDRDYFYTPAFLYFALLIGIGLSTILGKFRSWAKNVMPKTATVIVWPALIIIVLLMPVDTAAYHYHTHDRTGDYMPPDYAYNILNSCDQDGILFTNGDNDTFPLWYLQEVENVRKDVRVVNLSLLNTDWYILQLKHQMNVPIDLTDGQIIWYPFQRRGQITLYRPKETFYDPVRSQNRYLWPYKDPRTGKVVRVQDQMIEHIVLANKWKYPIYFATSVPESNRWTLNDYTLRKGMVLQVMRDKPEKWIDPDKTEDLIYNVYKYRGVDDLSVFKDENNTGLTTTYPERFIELATYYYREGDSTRSRQILFDSVDRFPIYYQNYLELMTQYDNANMPDSSAAVFQMAVKNISQATKVWPSIVLYHQFLGEIYFSRHELEKSMESYERAFELDPSSNISVYRLINIYMQTEKRTKGLDLMNYWLSEHPDDMYARNLYNAFWRSGRQ